MAENNIENNSQNKNSKKVNWGFTLFACVATGVITFLSMNLGEKASKIVDPDTGNTKASNITSNETSNSNIVSNEASNSNVDSNITNNSNVTSNVAGNSNVVSNQTTKLDLKTAFTTFAEQKQLSVSKEGYDQTALKSINCNEALNASNANKSYTVEMFMFDNSTNAKKEFDKQVNYQKSLAKKTTIVDEKNASNYEVFEAIIEVDPSKGANYEGHEYSFVLFARVDNGYISMYESSSNNSKNNEIKNATELKNLLGL